MSTTIAPLKYLFVAIYDDQTEYVQHPEDKAVIKESGSSFSDVDMDRVEVFILQGDGKEFEVNLKNGLFAVNGQVINIAPQHFVPTERLKLCFWRECRRHQNLHAEVMADMSVSQEGEWGESYVSRYFLGWETIWNGEKLQRTIAVE